MNWPNDADGDVFRRLADHNFDFSEACTVDYNVDFATWPPPTKAIELLAAVFGALQIFAPDKESGGYVQFQITGLLSYQEVCETQSRASGLMRPFGGVCESWGVMQGFD